MLLGKVRLVFAKRFSGWFLNIILATISSKKVSNFFQKDQLEISSSFAAVVKSKKKKKKKFLFFCRKYTLVNNCCLMDLPVENPSLWADGTFSSLKISQRCSLHIFGTWKYTKEGSFYGPPNHYCVDIAVYFLSLRLWNTLKTHFQFSGKDHQISMQDLLLFRRFHYSTHC